ncbi:MAG: hypothetical protein ACYC6L_13575 [Anaerolineae bacterium]
MCTGKEMSCCGLVCNDCDIYRLPQDEAVQAKILPWFKAQGWLCYKIIAYRLDNR